MRTGKQFDTWSGWHLLGPYVVCDFSIIVAVAGFILWEIIDEIVSRMPSITYYRHYSVLKIWDRGGASWGDWLCGAVGVGLWMAVHFFK